MKPIRQRVPLLLGLDPMPLELPLPMPLELPLPMPLELPVEGRVVVVLEPELEFVRLSRSMQSSLA